MSCLTVNCSPAVGPYNFGPNLQETKKFCEKFEMQIQAVNPAVKLVAKGLDQPTFGHGV